MKKLFLTTMIACGLVSANAQTPSSTEKKADIQFVDDSHDFGNIKEGTMATYEFTFKNTGTEPLILSDVHASCGCTTPEWTREPVAPGATGVIKAIFNSNGRPGAFSKSITVTSNAASGQKILTFRGTVEPSAQQADAVPPPPPAAPSQVDNSNKPVSTTPTPAASTTPTKPALKSSKTTTKAAPKPVIKPAAKPAPKSVNKVPAKS